MQKLVQTYTHIQSVAIFSISCCISCGKCQWHKQCQSDTLIFGTTDVRYLRSDTADKFFSDTDIRYYGSCVYSDCSVWPHSRCIQRRTLTVNTADAKLYDTYHCCQWAQLLWACMMLRRSLNKVLNDRNVNSDQRLLCMWPPVSALLMTHPYKNRPAADHSTAALGHTGVETRFSVNAACVASPPTTCMWTNNDLRPHWRHRDAAVIGGS